ncbi:TspO/MBR family protein [Roseospira marina]|nr:TspO/MBR family protein [Roseospira marina]MBB4312834.1 tryptophan-rich sensory protein [Roseospira marina]MBB5086393.1 tryptophan-rich sensory protein [Roseospira marina]
MDSASVIALAVILSASFATAMTAAAYRPDDWYAALRKPWWTPPNWLFPLAWAILYALMSASAFLVWSFAQPGEGTVPLVVYAVQLGLNALWSPVFFGMRRMGLAYLVVVSLWIAVLATAVLFFPINYWAGLLLMPYLVWVTVASFLNLSVWRLNRTSA